MVWRGLISIELRVFVIKWEPNNHYGLDRVPVCTGSGMYRLHYNILQNSIIHHGIFNAIFSRYNRSAPSTSVNPLKNTG